jgi:hypothetical protein
MFSTNLRLFVKNREKNTRYYDAMPFAYLQYDFFQDDIGILAASRISVLMTAHQLFRPSLRRYTFSRFLYLALSNAFSDSFCTPE